ncbi:hypothetical protein QWY99_08155 [Flavobacterium branchiarum]|uniref:RiboL-PSP-HEPN domain-containing protein n=1 Tax=Flavobacterium branchiarum TaxID=1114870 RepID=A0ABV5FS15_9FLAO|nr:hypothetical protein [Flavobacterium branchiarum]MDN3673022.1 hypothetical protein [Flavobacterium branchiarum]
MKHIKRNFLFHNQLQNDKRIAEVGNLVKIEEIDQQFLKKKSKDNFVIITTELDEKIFSFIYNDNGKQCMIPVPDFSLVNYSFAYNLNIKRKELRKNLVKNLADISNASEINFSFAYDYHGTASSCIISLFTSIECFINDIIPEEFEYKIKSNIKTEIYNKSQIQYSISFNDKLTKVLPQALGLNFFEKSNPTNVHIHNLRELRNEIIHTKSDKTGRNHVEILKRLLNFKYDETFEATFKLLNFYKKGFIEECRCTDSW